MGQRRNVFDGYVFELHQRNRMSHETGRRLTDFRIFRSSGVGCAEHNVDFGRLRPGDEQPRGLRVQEMTCAEIKRVQVFGGDPCEMGELDQYNDGEGLSLARVRAVPSDLLKFDS